MVNMNFGDAIKALKEGKKVTRTGWNGNKLLNNNDSLPNMYLWLKPETTIKSEWCKDPILKKIVDANGGEIEALSTICLKTADNKIRTGWCPTQTDIFSEDWIIL